MRYGDITDLHKSNKRSNHHCKSISGFKGWGSPLEGVWYSYPADEKEIADSASFSWNLTQHVHVDDTNSMVTTF